MPRFVYYIPTKGPETRRHLCNNLFSRIQCVCSRGCHELNQCITLTVFTYQRKCAIALACVQPQPTFFSNSEIKRGAV